MKHLSKLLILLLLTSNFLMLEASAQETLRDILIDPTCQIACFKVYPIVKTAKRGIYQWIFLLH